jgi:hypothetical protein
MKHEGRPAEEWLEILTTANAAQIRAKYGIADAPQLLADLLTDLGMVPRHDGYVQMYRLAGFENEIDWTKAQNRELPMDGKKKSSPMSTRALEQQTGFSRATIHRRRKGISAMIAAQEGTLHIEPSQD